jgi:ATP-dependent helicase/nuclease subunit A
MSQFTDNQRRAIETLERDCVVTAGPGAGKTRVLVERVINIVRQGRADLSQIVAITFTKKAANEMKERIRRALADLARRSSKRAEARRWESLKRQLEFATISTIHGFCSGVLRAQPVQARVDPAFATLDEYDSRLLLREAVEATVAELIDQQDAVAARLVIGYQRGAFISELARLYEAIRSLGLTIEQVEQQTLHNTKSAAAYTEALDTLRGHLDDILNQRNLPPGTQRQVDDLAEVWEKCRHKFPPAPTIESSGRFYEVLRRLSKTKLDARAKAIKESVQAYKDQLEQIELIFYDACAPEVLATIMKALRRAGELYAEAKTARRSLDFEDLQWKVRELFTGDPRLAQQHAGRCRFILVDEFQDTNGLQKQVLDLLTNQDPRPKTQDPRLSAPLSGPNLFIVGDTRQSVYNFRGAEVEVFDETARELEWRGAEQIELEVNFRSAPALVAFFNAFFSRAMTLESGDDEERMKRLGHVSYRPGQSHRQPPGLEVPVELLLDVGEHIEDSAEAREHEAGRVAARIWEMVHNQERLVAEAAPGGVEATRPVRYGDIAILFRALTDIKRYELALRRAGIPYVVVAGRGFYEREEIQDVLSLLRFLENRTDEIALVSALRSPLFGISDETLYWLRNSDPRPKTQDPRPQTSDLRPQTIDHHPLLTNLLRHEEIKQINGEQKSLVAAAAGTVEHLLSLRNRIPLANLVEEVLTTTDYAALQATRYDGHQRVANLAKLVDLARGFEASGPHFLTDFVRFIEQFTEMETREGEAQTEAGQQDAVQLMTIHKAKGLEFRVVILPDLARKPNTRAESLMFDRALGVGLKVPDARGRLHDTALRQRVLEHVELREHFEGQRLLFVAATRAQDYLVLAGSAKSIKTGRSLREATHWLEWVCTVLQIDDVSSLDDRYEWEGIPMKVAPIADLGLDELRARSAPVVDRYPEIRQGQPLAPTAGPSSESVAEDVKRIIEHLQPLPVKVDGTFQPLAVTRLLSLARCPLQFYYETVLGLPDLDQYEADLRPQTSDLRPQRLSAAERGKIVHSFCELYDGAVDPENVIFQAINRADVLEPEARARAAREVRPLVERYLNGSLYRQMEQVQRAGGRIESEVEFMVRTRWMPLRGRMDKLLIDAEGRATIIDFKTNRITAEQVEEVAKEYELQMRIYALAARRALRLEHIRAELYFIEPDVRVEIDGQRLDEAGASRDIDALCEQVLRRRRPDDFPPRPEPGRCRRCRCASFCPSRAL